MTDDAGIVTKISPRSVADTVTRFTSILGAKGVRVFDVIDQAAAAREAGQELRDTTLVIFGSPAAGTPVMAAAPLAALDLPLKALVWADDAGAVWVSYRETGELGLRYHVSNELLAPLHVIDSVVSSAVS